MPRPLLVETAGENGRGGVDHEPQRRVEEDGGLDLRPEEVIGQQFGDEGAHRGSERGRSPDPPRGADDDGEVEDLEVHLRRCDEVGRADRRDGQQRNQTPEPTPTHDGGFSQVCAARGDQVGVGDTGRPEQQRERPPVAVPVLSDDGFAGGPYDMAQDQDADDGVVEGADDGNELRDEVDR